MNEQANHSAQGTGVDLSSWLWPSFANGSPTHLDAQLVIACHDELVVERPGEQAMAATMDEIVNPGLTADNPDRVPVEVDVEVIESWDG